MTISLLLLSLPAQAQVTTLCGNLSQGKIVVGTAEHAEKITFNGKDIKIAPNGKFMLAFSRDDNTEHKLTITDFDGNSKEHIIQINKTQWDVQNLTGIEQKKVTPSSSDQAEIDRERTDIRGAQKQDTDLTYWQNSFIIPVEGRTSGNFGGQRIMNEKPMNPHMGMDIAALEGTSLKTPANGVVTLSGNNNYFYSGNVVVIDHGYGLYTIYAHMKDTSVKKGDILKQGDIIGTVGKTGRVTGAHLHWGASLNGTRFDPKSLLEKNTNCIDL